MADIYIACNDDAQLTAAVAKVTAHYLASGKGVLTDAAGKPVDATSSPILARNPTFRLDAYADVKTFPGTAGGLIRQDAEVLAALGVADFTDVVVGPAKPTGLEQLDAYTAALKALVPKKVAAQQAKVSK